MHVWHITISTASRMPLFRDEGTRRRAIHRLARLDKRHGVLFAFADEHFHDVSIGERDAIARLAGSIAHTLRPIAEVELAPAFIRPVEGRRHLQRLVPYMVKQPEHHGLDVHPALWTGSCFADLVGARDVPGLDSAIRELLPRFRLAEVYGAVGLPRSGIAPASDDQLRAAGALRIARAASAAACAAPDLRGRTMSVRQARRATARLARAAGVSSADIAWALDVTARSARRESTAPVRPQLLHATRLRLAIENAATPGSSHHAA